MNNTPTFGITLPTRSGGVLFCRALDSIAAQSFQDFALHIVIDGGTETRSIERDVGARFAPQKVKITKLPQRAHSAGHGPAFARNTGWWSLKADYLTSLDDDDYWHDRAYLCDAASALKEADADVHMANQRATENGVPLNGPIWLEGLAKTGCKKSRTIALPELLSVPSFCHLNTLIVKRSLFEALGGLDECLSYEEDRDYYLRVICQSEKILFLERAVSTHTVPSKGSNINASTVADEADKLLSQRHLFSKALLRDAPTEFHKYCLKAIADIDGKLALFGERNRLAKSIQYFGACEKAAKIYSGAIRAKVFKK